MRTSTETIEFYGRLLFPTTASYIIYDGVHSVCLPKSQVTRMRQVGTDPADYEFVIPYWLAKKKGIV